MNYFELRKAYARRLLSLIVEKGYSFELECDGEELLDPTSNVDDGADMMFEVDECTLYVLGKGGEAVGWIWWLNCNNWDESISDYTVSLDKTLNLSEWSDELVQNVGFTK